MAPPLGGLKLTPAATAAYNSSLTTSTPADLLKELSATTLSSIGGYTLTRTLGEGTFGKVKLARHRLTNTLVAIKIVDKIHAPAVVREISTWRHMHHPNIARLYEVMTSETRIYMVTEFCEGGEAFDYVCAHGRFDDTGPDVRRVFRQLVEAVGYCHDRRFVHRDLKLENVLLDYSLNVKLIDFGFTREINPRNLLDTYCGSIGYAAPEMIIGKQYDGSQVDVWSLGVIFYTLVCGYLPFDDDNESTMKRKILALDYDLPAFLAPDTCALIRAMLKLEGRERVTLKGILGDGWFGGDTAAIGEQTEGDFSTPAELELLRALETAGVDTAAMMQSVKANRCDQSCAMWYFSLAKQQQRKQHAGSVGVAPPSPSPDSVLASSPLHTRSPFALADLAVSTTGGKGTNGGSTPTDPPPPAPPKREMASGDYLALARRKTGIPVSSSPGGLNPPASRGGRSTGAAGSHHPGSSQAPAVSPSSATLESGRRGMLMNAMRGSPSPSAAPAALQPDLEDDEASDADTPLSTPDIAPGPITSKLNTPAGTGRAPSAARGRRRWEGRAFTLGEVRNDGAGRRQGWITEEEGEGEVDEGV